MSYQTLYAALARLNVQLTAMAALGAEMKLRLAGEAGHPAVRPLLQAIRTSHGAAFPTASSAMPPACWTTRRPRRAGPTPTR